VERRTYNVRPTIERFMSHVEKTEAGCWEWTGVRNRSGYGKFEVRGKTLVAHRWSYEHFVGPIPEGFQVDHVKARGCTLRSCVNPAHLEAVTAKENVHRSDSPCAENSRKTHCIRNHELSGDNVRVNKSGSRVCRACELNRNQRTQADDPEAWRTYQREYKRRKRAEQRLTT
jgi:hypothetical protein